MAIITRPMAWEEHGPRRETPLRDTTFFCALKNLKFEKSKKMIEISDELSDSM